MSTVGPTSFRSCRKLWRKAPQSTSTLFQEGVPMLATRFFNEEDFALSTPAK
jgi:hypothetical protein